MVSWFECLKKAIDVKTNGFVAEFHLMSSMKLHYGLSPLRGKQKTVVFNVNCFRDNNFEGAKLRK